MKEIIPLIIGEVNRVMLSEQLAIEQDIAESKIAEIIVESSDQEVCSICLDEISEDENELDVLDCAHEYHKRCIAKWMEQNPVCPECRAYIKLVEEFPPLVKR